jgi:uncharacterized protein with HEPN domain
MSERDPLLVLHDIEDAADAIHGLTVEMSFERFAADRAVHDAVLYNLLVIGEAVKHLPSRLTSARPGVPWQSAARMRDRLVHGYFHVSTAIVWETVEQDLPLLRAAVSSLLAEEEARDR